MSTFTSHYKTHLNASIEKVWDALTNPEIVKRYFFGTNLMTDWQVGHKIAFTGEWDGKAYEDKGIVQEYVPNQKAVYTYLSSWSGLADAPENYQLITYEVNEVDNGTELTITQTNFDEEKAKHSEESWASIIEGMKKLVE
jgi:uncharacterized protein YndB with AHSA1/START domain